jgi:hypothetical protein
MDSTKDTVIKILLKGGAIWYDILYKYKVRMGFDRLEWRL